MLHILGECNTFTLLPQVCGKCYASVLQMPLYTARDI
jgi:hypothetical protein